MQLLGRDFSCKGEVTTYFSIGLFSREGTRLDGPVAKRLIDSTDPRNLSDNSILIPSKSDGRRFDKSSR